MINIEINFTILAQVMEVEVEITANHLGYFEFRLCAHDNKEPATQACFDKHLLQLADGSGTRLPITKDMFLTRLQLRLPKGMINPILIRKALIRSR